MRWFIGLALPIALLLQAGGAEEKPQRLTLHCYESVRLQMTTKKNVVRVAVKDGTVLTGPSQLDTPSVALTGLAAGKTLVTLTDVDGAKETYEVAVQKPRQLIVSVGQTVRVQMSNKKPIAKVFNEKPGIVRVSPVEDDPTTIQVTGLMPGIVRITLIDGAGREEVHEAAPPLDKK